MQTTVASSNTVALDFGRALFGPIGGLIFSAMVAISCLGALQGADNARSIAPILSFFRFDIVFVGGLFTSARLVYASGQEGFLPSFFGQLHSRLKTPLNATALHATLTILFIAVGGGFRSLINFCESEGLIVIVGWLSCIIFRQCSWVGILLLDRKQHLGISYTMLKRCRQVCSLLVLRVKEPSLDRPYKTWLITPLIFSGVRLLDNFCENPSNDILRSHYSSYSCPLLPLPWKRSQPSVKAPLASFPCKAADRHPADP